MLATLAVLLGCFALQFITDPKVLAYPAVERLKEFADPVFALIGSWIGVSWPGDDWTARLLPLAMAAVVWGLRIIVLDGLKELRHSMESAAVPEKAPRSPRAAARSSSGRIASSGSKKEMDGLLEQYRRIEKVLHGAKKMQCAFLSVDVVGSTKMKTGESATVIAASFQAYEDFLRKILAKHQAWKQAWTPDGVLIGFKDVNDAVAATQQILRELLDFNRDENRMKTAFRVRCGVNEGELAIYDDTKLEVFSDPVIDVAMHMQKYAHPDALLLSDKVFATLTQREGFEDANKLVDEMATYQWSVDPIPPGDPTPTPTPALLKGVILPASPVAAPPVAAHKTRSTPVAAVTIPPPARNPVSPGSSVAMRSPAAPQPVTPRPAALVQATPIPAPGFDRTIAALPEARRTVDRIGRYEVLEELGRGAMGRVYKARDPQIGRTVAIKVLLTHDLAPDQIGPQKERFSREARASGKMSHPGIVTVFDVAEDAAGNPCLVMEFIEGTTLGEMLAPGREKSSVSFDERLRIAAQVADALDYAHHKGVIHRDIKPANVMVTRDGQAKITDFGIAKLLDLQATIGGGVLGTPSFVSPEQLSGATVDARSDIFSFGVVLYWMFTGEKPFKGDSVTAISFQIMHATPVTARQINFALPEELDAILSRCLAKNPADRYPSAAELASALNLLRNSRLPSARPPSH